MAFLDRLATPWTLPDVAATPPDAPDDMAFGSRRPDSSEPDEIPNPDTAGRCSLEVAMASTASMENEVEGERREGGGRRDRISSVWRKKGGCRHGSEAWRGRRER